MPTPDALKIIGIDPLDVDMVITSHFHYDHIGYLGLFERAQVVSGQKEYDYWFGKRDANALGGEFTTEENLVPVEKAQKEGRLRLISEATEVFAWDNCLPGGRALSGRSRLVAWKPGTGPCYWPVTRLIFTSSWSMAGRFSPSPTSRR